MSAETAIQRLQREYAERRDNAPKDFGDNLTDAQQAADDGSGEAEACLEQKVIKLEPAVPAPRTYLYPKLERPKQDLPLEVLEACRQKGLAALETRRELIAATAGPKADDFVPPDMEVQPKTIVFQHTKNATGIADSYENALAAIRALQLRCQYDAFHGRHIILDWQGREIGDGLDNAALKIRKAALVHLGAELSKKNILDALETECNSNRFNPVQDYLAAVKWDGVLRLDNWLIQYCGTEDTPLNRAIGRKLLIAAVRRARVPGCKFDHVVVLEGAQGAGKSTLLRMLAGDENFSDAEILGAEKREQQEATQGVWIYEIAELVGLSKADMNKVKHFVSKQVDRARGAYQRWQADQPRSCIFVATTNETNYLRDTTGNRRFWPVEVGTIDLENVARDRDQLWAEAALAEATGEPLVIPPELWADAAEATQARMEIDPWLDRIAPKLEAMQENGESADGKYALMTNERGEPEWRVSSDWLLTSVLAIPKVNQYASVAKNLAGVMRRLGWEYNEKTMKIGKHASRGYRKELKEPE